MRLRVTQPAPGAPGAPGATPGVAAGAAVLGTCVVRCRGIAGDGAGVCEIAEGRKAADCVSVAALAANHTGAAAPIARGGYVVFVRGLLPGESARVRLTSARASYARAELVERLDSSPGGSPGGSPERREPVCPHFGVCGGCDLLHMPYARELSYKRQFVADAFGRIGGLADILVEPVVGDWDEAGADFRRRYRNKGRYARACAGRSPDSGPGVSGVNRDASCVNRGASSVNRDARGMSMPFGFFGAGSHRVVGVGDCLLQKSENAGLLGAIAGWADAMNYGPDIIADVTVRTGERTGETAVILGRAPPPLRSPKTLRELGTLFDMLTAADSKVVALAVRGVDAAGDITVARGADGRVVSHGGGAVIHEVIGGYIYRVSGDAFFQVNTKMAESLYGEIRALARLGGADTVLDLYCGTGSISVFLAEAAAKVIGVEVSERAVADARENARANGAANTEFYAGRAEQLVPRLFRGGMRPDVVILDPPRRGCAPGLLDLVADTGVGRIVYVSCDPATLARDVRRLRARDAAYRVETVRPFDLFARTANVETVALLTRGAIHTGGCNFQNNTCGNTVANLARNLLFRHPGLDPGSP